MLPLFLEQSGITARQLDFYLLPYLPGWVSINLQSKYRLTIRLQEYREKEPTPRHKQKPRYKRKTVPQVETRSPDRRTYKDLVDYMLAAGALSGGPLLNVLLKTTEPVPPSPSWICSDVFIEMPIQ